MKSDNIDFKNRKHIHFTGIKGVGQAALAICAKEMCINVSGSDVDELFVTDDTLIKAGINWKKGFNIRNVSKTVDLVVTTGAHGGFDNPEVKSAVEKGVDIATYAEAMSDLANTKKIVTVVGVGGKTTTSSMLATLFVNAGIDPSYIVGVGSINPIGLPGHYSKSGKHFICEGDDYVVSPGQDNRAKFLLLNPHIIVVTNIEYDHPDVYPDLNSTLKVFNELFNKISKDGCLVANIDNKNVRKSIKSLKIKTYTFGFSKDADYVISKVKVINGGSSFKVAHENKEVILKISVLGEFNILNATAAYIVGVATGLTRQQLVEGISTYKGCRRRFEKVGEFNGALVYDDYAHHPKELKALLSSVKKWYPKKRLVAIFQPHTYSRTKMLFKQFSKAFTDVDVVGFMDIYSSSREKLDKTISSEILAEETRKHSKKSYYTGNHILTLKWLKENIRKGDVLLTIGAGDIFHLHKKLIKLS